MRELRRQSVENEDMIAQLLINVDNINVEVVDNRWGSAFEIDDDAGDDALEHLANEFKDQASSS